MTHSNISICVTIVIRDNGAGLMKHLILYSVDPFVVYFIFVFVVY